MAAPAVHTVASLLPALKEVWTSDTLVKQTLGADKLLDRLERETRYTIGEVAVVPIQTGWPGGYSAAPKTGRSDLNVAGSTQLRQPQYEFAYHYQQAKLEYAAVAQTTGKEAAVVTAADLALKNAVESLRVQLSRQAVSNGDALICVCASNSTTTVTLNATTGPQVLKRRWIHPGQTISIGTTADEDDKDPVEGTTPFYVESVSPSAGTFVVDTAPGASVTTSDYVSIHKARAGTTSYEMNGLKNIISTSSTLGGLAPSTDWEWAAASVDTSSTTLQIPTLNDVAQAVYQQTDNMSTAALTSYKQWFRFRELLQIQVRYAPGKLSTGDEALEYGGMSVEPHFHILDSDWFFVNYKDLFIVSPLDKPVFTDDVTGGGRLEWAQGTTGFVGAVLYPCNIAAYRRNSMAALTGLTA